MCAQVLCAKRDGCTQYRMQPLLSVTGAQPGQEVAKSTDNISCFSFPFTLKTESTLAFQYVCTNAHLPRKQQARQQFLHEIRKETARRRIDVSPVPKIANCAK